MGVAERAKRLGIPVVGISGSLGTGFQDVHEHGIDALAAITAGPMTLDEASERAAELIANATEQVLRFIESRKPRLRERLGSPLPYLPEQDHVDFARPMHARYELVFDVCRAAGPADEVQVAADVAV